MAEVRRRSTRTSSKTKPVSRRRDRARDEETDDEEETPRRTRRSSTRNTSTKRRRPDPEDYEDDEDEDDLDDEEGEEEDEDEDEDEEAPRSRSRRSRRSRDDDEDDGEDDTPPKRSRSRSSSRRSSSRRSSRSSRSTKSKAPAGVRSGRSGVDEVDAMAGGGAPRVKLEKKAVLVKILEREPLASFNQHWVAMGGGVKGERPFKCPGKGCPLCKFGSRKSQTVIVNVLQLSGGEPTNKVIQVGIKAWRNLEENATNRKGVFNMENGFFAVNRTGSGNQQQTNFNPVKERDLEEDWPEIFEEGEFDPEELPEIITDAKKSKFGLDIVYDTPMSELRDIARHLAEDDGEDEDDDEDDDYDDDEDDDDEDDED